MLHENSFRESLFSAEPVSPERQRRFREELAQIVEPRLTRGQRLYYMISAIGPTIGLPGAICGVVFDAQHRWEWALMLVVCGAVVWWLVHILRRGAEPLRTMQGMSKALAGAGMVVAAILIFRGLQNPSLANVLWAILGLLVCLVTNIINLWNRSISAERVMREDVLRVEYRLADLASRLPASSKPLST